MLREKSNDELNSRRDLQEMAIKHDLHLMDKGNKFYLSTLLHTLLKREKQVFCSRVRDLKLLDGYSSNIRNCISMEECRIIGLKSHDCHVLLQQLLSVALRGLLPKGLKNAIFRLCAFFNEMCQRVIDRNRVVKLEDDLCMLERFFPPSFFDIMVHLTIHLRWEACLYGPVQYHWM